METLEIHSKSFVVKWVHAEKGAIIAWQIKPIKKSINFGFYFHPGDATLIDMSTASRRSSVTSGGATLQEKLEASGLEEMLWQGKCVADELVRGSFTVENPGVYAFVFDNTFSKQTAKKVLFSQSVTSPGGMRLSVAVTASNSEVAPPQASTNAGIGIPLPGQIPIPENRHVVTTCVSDGRYLSGVMLKKRRKKLQGYARRYFILDNKYGLLNYYLDQKSSLLRGSMPLKLCVVTVHQKSREIILDSGMEVWLLKALSDVDWKMWVSGLDLCKERSIATLDDESVDISNNNSNGGGISLARAALKNSYRLSASSSDTNWRSIFALVQELEAVTERAKRAIPSMNEKTISQLSLNDSNSSRGPKWKRKPSRVSKVDDSPDVDYIPSSPAFTFSDVVADLTSLLSRFETIVGNQKLQLGAASLKSPLGDELSGHSPRESIYSSYSTDLFFDAKEDFDGVVYLEDEVDDDEGDTENFENEEAINSSSSDEEDSEVGSMMLAQEPPSDEKDLYPLPLNPVSRRKDVNFCTTHPPSLIGLIRKNVGKDLTTISMPVTCNEPVTILQRYAEQLESCHLLDLAAVNENACQRVLLIAAYVVSTFQSNKVKMRANRKPFNPLLGETYELVREDKGFRMIIEKVVHRPLVLAGHAESKNWTLHYTSRPNQKSWGKSVEISDSGPVRIKLNKTGEVFEYLPPTSYLRNIIAGEKYVEPVGQVKVTSSSGVVAYIEFKQGGMFSGRSEDLIVRCVDRDGREYSVKYEGKWTSELHEMASKKTIWSASKLLNSYEAKYGFSEFTASLNEITKIEDCILAPTDSRLRPDQRAYEEGQSDRAEILKHALEEKQRERRKEMESKNEVWKPVFFKEVKSNGNTPVFTPKEGHDNYWNRRKRGDWSGTVDLFTVGI